MNHHVCGQLFNNEPVRPLPTVLRSPALIDPTRGQTVAWLSLPPTEEVNQNLKENGTKEDIWMLYGKAVTN